MGEGKYHLADYVLRANRTGFSTITAKGLPLTWTGSPYFTRSSQTSFTSCLRHLRPIIMAIGHLSQPRWRSDTSLFLYGAQERRETLHDIPNWRC